jgi:hypothetical protein
MVTVDVLVNGKSKLSLTQNDYKAQGGQGTVYVKGGLAYKVYHDPARMIPEAKLNELSVIGIQTVLAPKDILYDTKRKNAIGFTMPFVTNTEYLTKMFSRNFKDANGVDGDKIIHIVTEMQKTLSELHKKNILVGDYNEMNFLVDQNFMTPYYIDVDSYQTPNFPCTAIMDTVRDRRLPFGKFDEMSDWFSWGIVVFQMYTGIHPYMGRHPNFKTTELDARMTQRVSVFDPDVKIPKVCQDFSAIPKNHLEWFFKVFAEGYRSEPPIAGATGFVQGFTPVVMTGTGVFIVDLVHDYHDRIVDVCYYNGTRYVITEKHIYKKESEVFSFDNSMTNARLVNVAGFEPLLAVATDGEVVFFNIAKSEIGSIGCDASMVSDGIMYSVVSGQLIENSFSMMAKLTHTIKVVDNIAPVFKIFDGVVVLDLFGKIRLSIPYRTGICASIMVPELEGYRIIDSKRSGRFAAFIVEKSGIYDRVVLFFNSDFNKYDAKKDVNIMYKSINMIVNQHQMLISIIEGETMELMMDVKRGEKRITDCPIEESMQLVDGVDRTMFVSGNKLYSVKMK